MEITIKIDGIQYQATVEQNGSGYWFCSEINGIEWDYSKGVQPGSKTPEEAANHALKRIESIN